MTNKIRYLKIRFANRIMPWEIPLFRAAVIENTNGISSLFHQHAGEDVIYRYPLIQYKVTDKKATIICLNAGADDIHYLLRNREFNFRIGDRMEKYEIEDVHLQYYLVQTWDTTFDYSLLNWFALNQKNFLEYQALEDTESQKQFLETKLTNCFIPMAKGIGWDIKRRIEVEIVQLKDENLLSYKGKKVLTFTLNFRCNVSLPNYVGLGKGSSVGFGIIKKIGDNRTWTKDLPESEYKDEAIIR